MQTKSSAWLARYSKQLLALLLFAAVAIAVLGIAAKLTAGKIARNERAWFEAQINALVPHELFDNDLLTDKTTVIAAAALGTRNRVAVYRARRNGKPTAAIINSVAPDGYGGPIELLVAVNYAGEVLGVQVLSHHETPGMGNDFELPGATWLDAFRGHSLHQPESPGWNVRKDGGEFQQFTSATISPRAIIKATQRTLDYYQAHRQQLFQAPSS
jgi:Na+-translocating ferredoxin:NAD+ oxidoreductase subunit G